MNFQRALALITVLVLGFAAPDAEYPVHDLGAPPTTNYRAVRVVGMNAAGQVLLTVTGSSLQGRSYLWSADGSSTPVDAPAGVAFPTVVGLSAAGQVLATYVAADGFDRAYVWSAVDGLQPLMLPNGIASQAVAISPNGVVAGNCQLPVGFHAFRWTAGGGIVDLGTPTDLPPWFSGSIRATCVSPTGDVAGTVSGFGPDTVFVWTAGGGMVSLSQEMGANYAIPAAMGSGGHVVGGGNFGNSILYTPGSGVVSLPFDFNFQNIQFTAINAGGVAIGTAFNNGVHRAIRWAGGPAAEFLVPDPVESSVGGINDAGLIVGTAGPQFGPSTAFTWTTGAGYQALSGLPGAPFNDAAGAGAVNAAGQVAGTGRGPDNQLHLIRWESDLTVTDLGTLGFVFPTAVFMNASGTIAGYGSTWIARSSGSGVEQYPLPAVGGSSITVAANASGQVAGYQDTVDGVRAFVWSQGLGQQQIGLLPGVPSGSTYAVGIDNAGNVTGMTNTSGGVTHPFLYSTTTGLIEDLGVPAGASGAQPSFMTPSGVVAGYFTTSTGVAGNFRWTRGGGLQTLPPLAVDKGTSAGSASNTGHVVGGAYDASFQSHPVLWPASGGIVDLSDPSLPNATPVGVSDNGTVGLLNYSDLPQVRLLDGTRITLSLPGFTGGQITKVTPEGIVLGFLNGGPLGAHGFYWTQATGIVDLSNSADYAVLFPHVTTAGFHIGGVQYLNGEYRPFLWTPGGGLQDLGLGSTNNGNLTALSIGEGDRLLFGFPGTTTGGMVWTSAGGLRPLDPIPGGFGANVKGSAAAGHLVFGTSVSADGDNHAVVWGTVPVRGSPVPHVTLVVNGNNVVVDASTTTDPDGDPLTYQWYVGTTLMATGPNASFTVPNGTISIRLVVTDPSGASTEQIVPLSQVDTTPPVAGIVNDGIPGDLAFQANATTISASWSGFSDPQSGIKKYEWAIGSTSGGTQLQGFTDVALATTATRSGLTLLQGKKYYVTVRATNNAGLSVLKSSNGVTVDLTPPKPGKVRNGLGPVDIDWQTSLTTMSANWDAATEDASGIRGYEWAIGTAAGGTQVQGFVSVGTATTATATGLTLTNGKTYFVTVRVTNGAGLTAVKSSDCITVDSTPPVAGTAKITDATKKTVTATWKDFQDPEGGIISYEWAIGSTPAASNLRGFLPAGEQGATATGLSLGKGSTIYVTVRAYNKAGLSTTAVSPGAVVK